jgi:hypothetical protein
MSYSRSRYRNRQSNGLGATVGDAGFIANRLGPMGALIVGLVGFLCFYFLIPSLLEAWLEHNKAKLTGQTSVVMGQALDQVFARRFIQPSEWVGLATLGVCSLIATWKLWKSDSVSEHDRAEMGFWAKLLARLLD